LPSLTQPEAVWGWLNETVTGTVYLGFQWYGVAGATASPQWWTAANLICVCLCLAGAFVAAARRSVWAAALGLIAAFLLGAASLHEYPARGRLLLYFVPWVLATVCFLIDFLAARARLRWMGAAVAALLLGWMAWQAIPRVAQPDNHSDARQAMRFIQQNRMPGDQVVMSVNSIAAWEYYRSQFALEDLPVLATLSLHGGFTEVTPVVCALAKRDRIWVVFTEASPNRSNILNRLLHTLPVIASRDADDGGAYLFDFSAFNSCHYSQADG
jgi:hypothetical protein